MLRQAQRKGRKSNVLEINEPQRTQRKAQRKGRKIKCNRKGHKGIRR